MSKTQEKVLIQCTAKISIKNTDLCRYVGLAVLADAPFGSIMRHLSFIADDLKEENNLPLTTKIEITLC